MKFSVGFITLFCFFFLFFFCFLISFYLVIFHFLWRIMFYYVVEEKLLIYIYIMGKLFEENNCSTWSENWNKLPMFVEVIFIKLTSRFMIMWLFTQSIFKYISFIFEKRQVNFITSIILLLLLLMIFVLNSVHFIFDICSIEQNIFVIYMF